MSDLAVLERHDGWAEIALNRPDRKNALTGPLADDLLAAVRSVTSDPTVQAVVIRGAGGAFCSGLDLKEFRAEPPPPWLDGFRPTWDAVHQTLFDARQVIITAVERYAINGGSGLALTGDLMVVGDDAFLQISEAEMGMAAPWNTFWMRARHPESVAARVMFLCDRVPADELLRLGIATEVVAGDQVVARARELATRLAGFTPGGLAKVKAGLRQRQRSGTG